MRTSGILLHPTSLPGPHGAGDLGGDSRRFVLFLERADQAWWQMLPIHPAGPGNSPYQALSTFAGSEQLIDLQELHQLGLLSASDVESFTISSRRRADFEGASAGRLRLLALAFDQFERGDSELARKLASELETFKAENSSWLEDWTLFAALREKYNRVSWTEWPDELARREPEALTRARNDHGRELHRFAFYQLLFRRQWIALRNYAAEHGVKIMGDLPMFVAHDSADVWARRELFRLDESGQPLVVSGAPPDDFNPGGQTWGHPLFNWKAVADANWDWWRERVAHAIALSDSVRLDHFVGYNAAWEVPVSESGAPDSAAGAYGPGPGASLFDALGEALGELPFVAEDLGDMNSEVEKLRVRLGYPGMRVLQFAFTGDPKLNIHLPSNYTRDSIAYTGTHDNDTIAGWFSSLPEAGEERNRVLAMTDGNPDQASWNLIKLAQLSVADMCIIPMQDLYGMKSRARMNRPGTASGNWNFRLRPGEINNNKADQLKALTTLAGRASH